MLTTAGNTQAQAQIQGFIARWAKSSAAERANYQLFLSELCDVLDVPRPEPTLDDDTQNAYVFERVSATLTNPNGHTSYIRGGILPEMWPRMVGEIRVSQCS